ncbi:hypothetical protein SLA2020_228170 [Shorea laevis]
MSGTHERERKRNFVNFEKNYEESCQMERKPAPAAAAAAVSVLWNDASGRQRREATTTTASSFHGSNTDNISLLKPRDFSCLNIRGRRS